LSGSSDQLVDEVLKRIAEKTKANDPAGAKREAEEGFARCEKQEGEQRASALASGVALLEASLKTDLLRFDAAAAAGRVEKIASLQHEEDPKALFDAVRVRQDQFDTEGRDKDANFSLAVMGASESSKLNITTYVEASGDSRDTGTKPRATLRGI
jgi:hypothetical protein